MNDKKTFEPLIERLARWVVGRRLTVPVIFMLEMHRPMSFITSQFLVMFTPFLSLTFNGDELKSLALLLERREGIEWILLGIEAEETSYRNRPVKESSP